MLDRPPVSAKDAARVLATAADDPLEYASVAMLVLVGLRPSEAVVLRPEDYAQEKGRPVLSTGTFSHPRTIEIAPTAARALDMVIESSDGSSEFLLPGMSDTRLVRLVRSIGRGLELDVGVHQLREAAVRVGLEDGTPVQHIEAYFGFSKAPGRRDLVPVREGYDHSLAQVLEETFVAADVRGGR
ncbi:tyrosine-type recombinase/integrase [Streptomyces triculaminicus]|uniref:tyrosine-type recombinase/integrase n=1 Tax=Streptomyces triculaminicus TaxID=2816232 RepID=UPI0037930610